MSRVIGANTCRRDVRAGGAFRGSGSFGFRSSGLESVKGPGAQIRVDDADDGVDDRDPQDAHHLARLHECLRPNPVSAFWFSGTLIFRFVFVPENQNAFREPVRMPTGNLRHQGVLLETRTLDPKPGT